jgi:hypothetical protein
VIAAAQQAAPALLEFQTTCCCCSKQVAAGAKQADTHAHTPGQPKHLRLCCNTPWLIKTHDTRGTTQHNTHACGLRSKESQDSCAEAQAWTVEGKGVTHPPVLHTCLMCVCLRKLPATAPNEHHCQQPTEAKERPAVQKRRQGMPNPTCCRAWAAVSALTQTLKVKASNNAGAACAALAVPPDSTRPVKVCCVSSCACSPRQQRIPCTAVSQHCNTLPASPPNVSRHKRGGGRSTAQCLEQSPPVSAGGSATNVKHADCCSSRSSEEPTAQQQGQGSNNRAHTPKMWDVGSKAVLHL